MFYLGIDLGGTNIAVGIVDEKGRLVLKDSVPTYSDRHHSEIIKDMAMLSLKIIETAGVNIVDVAAVGIGSPGTPDAPKGIIVYSNNLKFNNVPMREGMNKYIDLPVYIENDANCAALAESIAGAAAGAKNSMTVTLGTGVGSGVIIDGKIYNGFNSAAVEFGHTVIVSGGEQCTCGRKGCWEAYASATGLIRQTRKAAEENPESLINELVNRELSKINAKTAFDAARQGDETGMRIIEQYIRYLAEGITNAINTFMPEILVIGGGICKEGEYLLGPLRKLVSEATYSNVGIPQTQIRTAQMGNDAGIIGAAMLGKTN